MNINYMIEHVANYSCQVELAELSLVDRVIYVVLNTGAVYITKKRVTRKKRRHGIDYILKSPQQD